MSRDIDFERRFDVGINSSLRRTPVNLRVDRRSIKELNDRQHLQTLLQSKEYQFLQQADLKKQYNELLKRLFKQRETKKKAWARGRGGLRVSRAKNIRDKQVFERGERRSDKEEEVKVVGEDTRSEMLKLKDEITKLRTLKDKDIINELKDFKKDLFLRDTAVLQALGGFNANRSNNRKNNGQTTVTEEDEVNLQFLNPTQRDAVNNGVNDARGFLNVERERLPLPETDDSDIDEPATPPASRRQKTPRELEADKVTARHGRGEISDDEFVKLLQDIYDKPVSEVDFSNPGNITPDSFYERKVYQNPVLELDSDYESSTDEDFSLPSLPGQPERGLSPVSSSSSGEEFNIGGQLTEDELKDVSDRFQLDQERKRRTEEFEFEGGLSTFLVDPINMVLDDKKKRDSLELELLKVARKKEKAEIEDLIKLEEELQNKLKTLTRPLPGPPGLGRLQSAGSDAQSLASEFDELSTASSSEGSVAVEPEPEPDSPGTRATPEEFKARVDAVRDGDDDQAKKFSQDADGVKRKTTLEDRNQLRKAYADFREFGRRPSYKPPGLSSGVGPAPVVEPLTLSPASSVDYFGSDISELSSLVSEVESLDTGVLRPSWHGDPRLIAQRERQEQDRLKRLAEDELKEEARKKRRADFLKDNPVPPPGEEVPDEIIEEISSSEEGSSDSYLDQRPRSPYRGGLSPGREPSPESPDSDVVSPIKQQEYTELGGVRYLLDENPSLSQFLTKGGRFNLRRRGAILKALKTDEEKRVFEIVSSSTSKRKEPESKFKTPAIGDVVDYIDKDGAVLKSTVTALEKEKLEPGQAPSLTIKLPDGRERNTTLQKISGFSDESFVSNPVRDKSLGHLDELYAFNKQSDGKTFKDSYGKNNLPSKYLMKNISDKPWKSLPSQAESLIVKRSTDKPVGHPGAVIHYPEKANRKMTSNLDGIKKGINEGVLSLIKDDLDRDLESWKSPDSSSDDSDAPDEIPFSSDEELI